MKISNVKLIKYKIIIVTEIHITYFHRRHIMYFTQNKVHASKI